MYFAMNQHTAVLEVVNQLEMSEKFPHFTQASTIFFLSPSVISEIHSCMEF